MKIILALIASLLFQVGHAKTAKLPESSFSVELTTGKWMESATEGSTRRIWNGKEWKWEGDKKNPIYHYSDKLLTSVTPAGKASIFYSYDAKGRLVKREEGDKHFIKLLYDAKGRVAAEQAPLGKDASPITLARFNYASKFTEVFDAYGTKKVYHYNSSKEIIKIEHFNETGLYRTETFKWEEGLLKKQTLESKYGREILVQKNVWGSSGRLKEQIITGDLTGHGRTETFTQHYHYNSKGALKKVTGSDGSVITAESLTPPKTAPIIQTRSDGLPAVKTFPNGEAESYEWDIYGNMVSQTKTREGGKTTRYTYDYMNRLIRESDGFSFEYDYLGRQTKQIDPDGNETELVYDVLGRVIKKIEPEVLAPDGSRVRPTSTYKYNELDQMIETTDPDGWTTKYRYTVRGQLSKIIHPDGTVENTYYQLNGLKEGETFNEAEAMVPESEAPPLPPPAEEDPSHSQKVINDRGQQVLQKIFVDFAGIKSVRTFDALGRLEKVEKYNLLGDLFLTKEIRYTPAGIKAIEIINGETVEWQWGPGEKLLAVIEDKGTTKERTTRYLYDQNGRLSHFIKPSGLTLYYTYDRSGALIALKSSDGSIDNQFIWNENGRLSEALNLKTGKKTCRFYDENGILFREILENGLEVKWEKKALVLPDLSRIRYQRDENGILKSISRENPEGNTLYTHNYTSFNASGRLSTESMVLGLGTTSYERDAEERVIAITSPYRQEKLSYNGLLLKSQTVDGVTRTFEYDAEFKLKTEKKKNPELDRDGNTLSSEGHSLKYDALGRLIDVDGTYFYDYDAFGRRISKRSPQEHTLYFWDGMEEIGAATPQGSIKELKVMGSAGPVAVELNGIAHAALLDAKGSIAKLVSHTGTYASPWTYQGKRGDPETGFIYFGARFLDPSRGQFLTPDPKGFTDGRDLYQFARYNPNAFSDSWGHTAIMDGFKSLVSTGWNTWLRINRNLTEWREHIDNLSGMKYFHHRMEDLATLMLGKGFLIQSGYWRQERQTGVYGEGEINDRVRITFNHGILNVRSDLADNLRQISLSHGGCNVHYVFRPTGGFAWDLFKCMLVKSGYLSPEARELIRIWKGLIEEMGGVDGGGKIIHYTHSVGGADTWAALSHLSSEEQKMLDIRTFGSATLIPDIGTYQITNYVSKRDGVSFFDPIHFFGGLFSGGGNVVFVGTLMGIPFIDHPLSVDSYQQVIRALGQAFLETYSG